MTKIIPFIVKITYEEASKDAPFVAYSPEFDVASAGLTKAQAKKNLSEALSLVLAGAKEDGNLSEILEEAGFSEKEGQFHRQKIEIEELSVHI